MKTLKKALKILGIGILLLIIVGASVVMYNWRDRHPDYSIDLKIDNKTPQPIKAGFAKRPITPTIVDTWNDANGNNKYSKAEGDTYNDNNNNGKFDAYWIAGMSNAKPAQGVHDDVWSRAMVRFFTWRCNRYQKTNTCRAGNRLHLIILYPYPRE